MKDFDQPGDGPPDNEPIRDTVHRILNEALNSVTGGEPEKQEEILEKLDEITKNSIDDHDTPIDP